MQNEPFSARDLYAKEIPPLRWTVHDLLPEGVYLLVGAPKIGKSFMALDLCLAVAAGAPVLGEFEAEQGEVLYLALEDGERRLKDRMEKLYDGVPPQDLFFQIKFSQLDQGGLTKLSGWLKEHPKARLLVIDTFAKVKPKQKSASYDYYQDYASGEGLVKLARDHRVAILLVHHTRKMPAEDPIDEISGTLGLAGVVDGAWILKRKRTSDRGTLFITGRDMVEQELRLKWDSETFKWTALGESQSGPKMSSERIAIITCLMIATEPLTPKEIADQLNKDRNSIKQLMWQMGQDGQINALGGGRYELHIHNNQ